MKCVYEGTGTSDEASSSRVHASNSELQDRLSRLEGLIEGMAGASISDSASQNGSLSAPRTPYILFDQINSPPEELGKVVFGPSSSVYVDPSAWVHSFDQVELITWVTSRTNLHLQIEQLSFYLDDERASRVVSSPTSPNFVFSFGPDAPPPEIDFYPAIKQSETLVNLFFQNVEPFMMILHQGLFRKELEQYRRQIHPHQQDFEALLFCVHALGIVTLPSPIAEASFAKSKEAMIECYGLEAEKALARCNIMKSRSIVCLQALLCHIVGAPLSSL